MLLRFFRPLTQAFLDSWIGCPQACAWGYLLLPADAGFDLHDPRSRGAAGGAGNKR